VITRLEGGVLVALYVAYLAEQLLLNISPGYSDEFRLVVLVVLMPTVMVFLSWQVLAWREQSRLP
jgi:cation:H+ antiporter